jgi:ABC-type branched-subunit amino acid transport system ATPase component
MTPILPIETMTAFRTSCRERRPEDIMHPMFVKLFLETGVDDLQADEPDMRRPANRACRRRRSPRAGVGYVPQVDDVFAPLTVRENLEMVGYLLAGREVSQRIEGVVSVFPRLGQMLTRRAGRLSAGERKMLAMGRMLMLEPAVFLLDEPTANLAARVATDLLTGHVRAPAGAGAGVLVVEQRARAVLAISDCTSVLGGGQVLMADTPRAPVREAGIHRAVLRRRPSGASDPFRWRPRGVTAAGRSGRLRPAATRPR